LTFGIDRNNERCLDIDTLAALRIMLTILTNKAPDRLRAKKVKTIRIHKQ